MAVIPSDCAAVACEKTPMWQCESMLISIINRSLKFL